MASIEYEDIYSYFLGYVTDLNIMNLDEDDAYTLMSEYLHKALSKTYLRRLFSAATLDDDEEMFTFVMSDKVDDDSDEAFVLDILSKAMVVEWLQPQVKSKINTQMLLTGKEQNYYSQANHLSELRGLLEDITLDVRNMIKDRTSFYNSYLDS